jgi:hypothetical protein
MAITDKNPSYKNEAEGRVRHYAFNWVGGGYNDVWAANEYEAIILANSWFNIYSGNCKPLVVSEGSVKDITGNEAEYHKSLPFWD